MHVLLIVSPMTNMIITSSFVVGSYSLAMFLVFQVSIKVWKGDFSFKSEQLIFKEKKHKWPFFSIFTPNFTVSCMQTNHTHHKEIFPGISLIISKIITNVGFFGNFLLKIFARSKTKKCPYIHWPQNMIQ